MTEILLGKRHKMKQTKQNIIYIFSWTFRRIRRAIVLTQVLGHCHFDRIIVFLILENCTLSRLLIYYQALRIVKHYPSDSSCPNELISRIFYL
jgi:hypothetical protein